MQQVQGEKMILKPNETSQSNKTKLIIDIGIFIGFLLIAMEPHASGLTIHEWLATWLSSPF